VPCDACTEYIMKMKGLEYKVNDLVRDRENKVNYITDLRAKLASADQECTKLQKQSDIY
jgi:hypothetical protein